MFSPLPSAADTVADDARHRLAACVLRPMLRRRLEPCVWKMFEYIYDAFYELDGLPEAEPQVEDPRNRRWARLRISHDLYNVLHRKLLGLFFGNISRLLSIEIADTMWPSEADLQMLDHVGFGHLVLSAIASVADVESDNQALAYFQVPRHLFPSCSATCTCSTVTPSAGDEGSEQPVSGSEPDSEGIESRRAKGCRWLVL